MRKRLLALAIVLVGLLAFVPSVAHAADGELVPEFATIAEVDGKRIGVSTGSVFMDLLVENHGGTYEFSYYNTYADFASALKSNRIDAFAVDDPIARLIVNQNDGITIMPEVIATDDYGFFFQKGSPLTAKFSEVIERFELEGTLDKLKEKWTGADEDAKAMPEQDWDAPNGTIKMVTNAEGEPLTYLREGKIVGYDIEIAMLVCKELGYRLEVRDVMFDGMLAAVASGKADFGGGGVSITKERAEQVDFATANYYGAAVLVVRGASDGSGAGLDVPTRLAESFRKTFIDENRWQLILSGLGVTITISVCSGFLGTLLGFGTVLLRRRGSALATKLVDAYDALMGGLPLVVILMVLYYVVFGSFDIAGEIVAILAFMLAFGSTAGSTMWTAIDGIDVVQEECGLALGYTRQQVFRKVIFPQAAQQFLPQLMGQFVSLVKDTAIVGYIAVQDLTRASDLIRARTMDAFFPLVSTALIYFVFCRLLAWALGRLTIRFKVENRSREVKGVEQ